MYSHLNILRGSKKTPYSELSDRVEKGEDSTKKKSTNDSNGLDAMQQACIFSLNFQITTEAEGQIYSETKFSLIH